MPQKLYILIRKDLTPAQQGVQAGHAVAEFCLHWNREPDFHSWENGTLVYVTVPNEDSLLLWLRKCDQRSIRTRTFREPDIGDQLTAIACLHDGNLFDKLPLWDPVTDWIAENL